MYGTHPDLEEGVQILVFRIFAELAHRYLNLLQVLQLRSSKRPWQLKHSTTQDLKTRTTPRHYSTGLVAAAEVCHGVYGEAALAALLPTDSMDGKRQTGFLMSTAVPRPKEGEQLVPYLSP